MAEHYRTGRSVGRTIYRVNEDGTDSLIGVMDTRELARLFVDAVNAREAFEISVLRAVSSAGAPKPLDCGCPCDGRPEYTCLDCGHSRCALHRDADHACAAKIT